MIYWILGIAGGIGLIWFLIRIGIAGILGDILEFVAEIFSSKGD